MDNKNQAWHSKYSLLGWILLVAKTEKLGLLHLNRFMDMCHDLGVPLPEKKTFPPANVMPCFDFEIETVMNEFRLPKEKVDQCISEISYLLTS